MTVTEDAPAAAPAVSQPTAPAPAATGLASILGTGDHKVVGRVWLVASLLHLVLAGAAALFVAVLRIDPQPTSDNDFFAQAVTLRVDRRHLPLPPAAHHRPRHASSCRSRSGAATIAFPRAAAAAAWTYLLGGGLVIGAYAIDGGPFGSDTDGVRLFIVAFLLVLAGPGGGVDLHRAPRCSPSAPPGMSLRRVPAVRLVDRWWPPPCGSSPCRSSPVLVARRLHRPPLRRGQRLHQRRRCRSPSTAASPGCSASRRSTPSPSRCSGFVGSVVPVFSAHPAPAAPHRHGPHRRLRGVRRRRVGACPPSAPTRSPGSTRRRGWRCPSRSCCPLLGLLGLWALTAPPGLAPSSPARCSTPPPSVLMLLVGLAIGALQAIEPIETLVDGDGTSLYGTSVTTSVASYVVLAATIAAFGGVVYWAPKILGRLVPEAGARLVALLLLVGTVVWSLPDLISGPARPARLPRHRRPPDNLDTIKALNTVSAIGGGRARPRRASRSWLLLRRRAPSKRPCPGDDPWSGHTLEWATSSPPPAGNFASLPEITSEAPLYDARRQPEEAIA